MLIFPDIYMLHRIQRHEENGAGLECPRSHTSVLNVYETSALKKAPNNENGVQNNGRCTPSAIQFMSDQM